MQEWYSSVPSHGAVDRPTWRVFAPRRSPMACITNALLAGGVYYLPLIRRKIVRERGDSYAAAANLSSCAGAPCRLPCRGGLQSDIAHSLTNLAFTALPTVKALPRPLERAARDVRS
eukprot:3565480-Pleurochrysis_carterae.AAC.2